MPVKASGIRIPACADSNRRLITNFRNRESLFHPPTITDVLENQHNPDKAPKGSKIGATLPSTGH